MLFIVDHRLWREFKRKLSLSISFIFPYYCTLSGHTSAGYFPKWTDYKTRPRRLVFTIQSRMHNVPIHFHTVVSTSLPYLRIPDFIIKSPPLLYHSAYIATYRRLQTNYHPVISPRIWHICTLTQALVRKQVDIQSHKCMQVIPCNWVFFCFISWRQMTCKQTERRGAARRWRRATRRTPPNNFNCV